MRYIQKIDFIFRTAPIYNYKVVSEAMHFGEGNIHKDDIRVFLLAANALVNLVVRRSTYFYNITKLNAVFYFKEEIRLGSRRI